MHFLIDEDLPESVCDLLKRYHHQFIDVRNSELRGSADSTLAAYAREKRLCLITGDFGFADIRNYPPGQYHGIVVLRLPAGATASDILEILQNLFNSTGIIEQLDGKLAIIEKDRVRIRRGL